MVDRSAERERPASSSAPHRHVLLVEDSLPDVRLFRRCVRDWDADTEVSVAEDGASAIDLLDEIIEGTVLTPDLLVLDLNLPVLKGWQVLRYTKRSPLLRSIPVVVLSNSEDPADADRAYREGATSFLRKGRDLDGFLSAVDTIHAFLMGMEH